MPPKIHNLVLLAEKAGLELPADRKDFLRRFNVWQLEGRYGDVGQIPLDHASAEERMASAREMVEWLKQK